MSDLREDLPRNFLPAAGSPPVDWIVADGLTDYAFALERMEAWAAAIAQAREPEKVWLVEHPALYTAGTSAKPKDLLTKTLPVFEAGRGGQYTYHGPGQRVAYVMLDLSRRRRDVRAFVGALEAWLIAALAMFNVRGETRENRVGVWTPRPEKPPGADGEPARGQDRGDWRAVAPLGVVPWRLAQCRAGLAPFRGHRSLRHRRAASWGDQPGRSRPTRGHGGGGYGAASSV